MTAGLRFTVCIRNDSIQCIRKPDTRNWLRAIHVHVHETASDLSNFHSAGKAVVDSAPDAPHGDEKRARGVGDTCRAVCSRPLSTTSREALFGQPCPVSRCTFSRSAPCRTMQSTTRTGQKERKRIREGERVRRSRTQYGACVQECKHRTMRRCAYTRSLS